MQLNKQVQALLVDLFPVRFTDFSTIFNRFGINFGRLRPKFSWTLV